MHNTAFSVTNLRLVGLMKLITTARIILCCNNTPSKCTALFTVRYLRSFSPTPNHIPTNYQLKTSRLPCPRHRFARFMTSKVEVPCSRGARMWRRQIQEIWNWACMSGHACGCLAPKSSSNFGFWALRLKKLRQAIRMILPYITPDGGTISASRGLAVGVGYMHYM
jgi:hypothetical protein